MLSLLLGLNSIVFSEGPNEARPARVPIALAASPNGRHLFVANRGVGSISLIDLARKAVVAEPYFGGRFNDLAMSDDGRFLFVCDERDHTLLRLEFKGDEFRPRGRVKVPPYPVSVRLSRDGRSAFVCSLWSRQVTRIDLEDGEVTRTQSVDLPFAPRGLLPLDKAGKLLVMDAFGGTFAMVDMASWSIDSVRELKAHNIVGLAVHPDGRHLLMTHQDLNRAARSTSDDIHWGFLVSNNLRWLLIEDLLDPSKDPADRGRVTNLGRPGDGGGDPGGLALAPDGTAVIALSGVGRVAVGPVDEPVRLRVSTGQRPTAVTLAPDGRHAYVANSYDDSITIMDLPEVQEFDTIALGPKSQLSPVERGERLFHDARLSQEGWMSCHSCHGAGHSNHRLADTLGDESYGAPKRVPSLLGVGLSAPYGWNGKVPDLAAQVIKSTRTTMRGRGLNDDEVAALVSYMKALAPPPSLDRLRGRLDEPGIRRGEAIFADRCERCHSGPARADGKEHDVGLTDEDGNSRFNTPSLLGVSQRDRFLHDGQHRSLEDVLVKDKHPRDGLPLTNEEAADLIAYLRGL